jgi:predicted GNAT family acetyltransferase
LSIHRWPFLSRPTAADPRWSVGRYRSLHNHQKKGTIVTTENNLFEYPDAAGYPDGAGFLDEGTADLVSAATEKAVRNVDRPSADTDAEIAVHRLEDERMYVALMAGREIASIRYEETDNRITLLATTVAPEFRGRGLATDLISDVLEDIRGRGEKLTVFCPMVAAFLTDNRQYSSLLS